MRSLFLTNCPKRDHFCFPKAPMQAPYIVPQGIPLHALCGNKPSVNHQPPPPATAALPPRPNSYTTRRQGISLPGPNWPLETLNDTLSVQILRDARARAVAKCNNMGCLAHQSRPAVSESVRRRISYLRRLYIGATRSHTKRNERNDVRALYSL